MVVRDALNSAIDEEMAADPKVFVIGEEVRLFDDKTEPNKEGLRSRSCSGDNANR